MTSRGFISFVTIITLVACGKNAVDTATGVTSVEDTGPDFDPNDTDATTPAYEGAFEFSGDQPYNVLMISLDTTRIEDLGRYTGEGTTPNLDALFEKSVVLDNHRSCSNWTYSSTLCVQSGGWDLDLGFVPNTFEALESAPDSILQAAEVLGDAGWSSYLVSTNSFLSSQFNNAQGFDGESVFSGQGGGGGGGGGPGGGPPPVDLDSADGADVTEVAVAQLEALSSGDSAWYFHAHYLDPHDPYDPPEEYLDGLDALDSISYDLSNSATIRELNNNWENIDSATQELVQQHIEVRYRGELAYVDAQIGSLLEQAEAMGALENTLVVFWTDHGEQIGEHGTLGHDYDMYDEVNVSIASFYAEGITPVSWTGPTTHEDIWPTILEILPWDFGAPFLGMPVGTREADDARFGLKYLGTDDTVMFVEQSEKKLIYYWSGRTEFYDLSTDADEFVDNFDVSDADVQALWALLEPKVREVEALYPSDPASDPGI